MSKLLLMDGHSILNRAFFGLPDFTNSAGEHTGAVLGFLNIMLKVIDEEKPDYITVAFDVHAPTFRHKMFDGYKGTRKPMASELKEQVPRMQELLKAMGVTVVTMEGFEADDILGTLSRVGESAGMDVTILSGDRDLLQLATKKVKISIPKTKKTGTEIENYYESDVMDAYGVTPTEFIDVKALWGDTADNIPGVEGIGEKTATTLIAQYHSIEECYAHVDEIKPPRASKNLKEQYETAVLSKELATINVNVPLEYDINDAHLDNLFTNEAYTLCKKYELRGILKRFEEVPAEANSIEEGFETVTDKKRFDEIIKQIDLLDESVEIGAHFISNEGMILGLALSYQGNNIYAVAKEDTSGGQLDLLSMLSNDSAGSEDISAQLLARSLCSIAKKHVVCMWDIKSAMHLICKTLELDAKVMEKGAKEILLKKAFDTSVAAYLVNPIKNGYYPDNTASEYLGIIIPSDVDIFGKEKLSQALLKGDEKVTKYACYFAYTALAIKEGLIKDLCESQQMGVYDEIELPLLYTLFDMEVAGIAMDESELRAYGDKLLLRIKELEQSIYDKAGEEFNINSPKQLGVILFEKLQIEGGKKTKTGYSTAADVLEGLAGDYPIVADILEYRQLAKLNSTYVEGLSSCLSLDGRIHSTFMQTVTATGRISSTEPNLQNIPIRMELGRQIRKVFHARKGYVFIDADYSQIELRVLAHMSGDEALIDAFNKGQDIHRSTASLVFGVPFDEVTDLMRRRAKAVNFGIVYGISAFGLARDLGIDRKEAQKYIDDYFVAYPKMKEFLDGLIENAKELGYAQTMYSRKRPIPELSSSNFMQRSFGERIAMNSPIQGTAADIIKIAMVRVHDRLIAEGVKARLLLQVHDELLIEAPNDEAEHIERLLAEEMENAAKMAVALEVDMHRGITWYEAK